MTSTHPTYKSAENLAAMSAKVDEERKRRNAEEWSNNQEDLLVSWGEKAAGYRWLHDKSQDYYSSRNDFLSYPTIVLSCVCGVGGFSTVGNNTQILIQYCFAIINILVSMLSSLQKFQRNSEYAEQHRTAACAYAKFYRNVALEMSLPPEDRTPVKDILNQSRVEYDRLLSASPDIPPMIVEKFRQNFSGVKHKPDVANGITEIKTYKNENLSESAQEKLKGFIKKFTNNVPNVLGKERSSFETARPRPKIEQEITPHASV